MSLQFKNRYPKADNKIIVDALLFLHQIQITQKSAIKLNWQKYILIIRMLLNMLK